MRNTRLIIMIEGAIITGICVALSYIPLNTANADFDLSLGLIPLGVYALRRGPAPGLAAGFVWGLLMIVLGKAFILSIPQVLLEYPLAFAFGGFGGVFSGLLRRKLAPVNAAGNATGNASVNAAENAGVTIAGNAAENAPVNTAGVIPVVVFASISTAVARWFFHFWAGVVFWGSYAPPGMSPYLYSFIFNGASATANAVMLAVILSILVKTARPLFIPKDF